MERRFSSRIDGWLIPVMVLAVGGLVAAFVAVLLEPAPWPLQVLVGAATVLVTLLLISVFRNTHYTITNDVLRIVSGPFKWNIDVADILDVTPSRNLLSSPALSLDRLKISLGKRRFILVSPEDKDGFMRAIEQAQRSRDSSLQ